MSLPQQLAHKKAAILKIWAEMVMNSYPAETARFLSNQKDPFANPVGQTTQNSLATLLDLLLDDQLDGSQAQTALDPVIRIRAVQDFSPAQATRFVFDLKSVVRKHINLKRIDPQLAEDMVELDNRIDALGLLAFDIFMQCREKIFHIKANELRDRTFKAFARAGLVKEPPEDA